MKKALLIFLLLTTFACDKESKQKGTSLETVKIIGSWQVVSQSYSIGGPLITEPVERGGIYSFALDGGFTFEYSQDNARNYSGKYTFEGDMLTLAYTLVNEDLERVLKTSFENNEVEFIPTNPICIEGCSTTLKRL